MSLKEDLRYYLEREPSPEDLAEADEWLGRNPGGDIAEWAQAIVDLEAGQ